MEILLVASFITLSLAIVVIAFVSNYRRTKDLEAEATRLGLQLCAQLAPQDQDVLDQLPLSRQGRWPRQNNVMVADSGEVRITLFDHSYRKGSGKNKRTIHQSVLLAQSDSMNIPPLSIAPEGMLSWLGDLIMGNDIDFTDDKQFSDSYVLSALNGNADSVRNFMNSQRRQAVCSGGEICIECAGSSLLVYRRRRRINSQEIEKFMAEGLRLTQVFSG